jgi:hypothetical protein
MLLRLKLERHLTPAYLLNGCVYCWRCSICGKLFVVPTDVKRPHCGKLERAEVRRDFHLHDCGLHFAGIVEKLERVS